MARKNIITDIEIHKEYTIPIVLVSIFSVMVSTVGVVHILDIFERNVLSEALQVIMNNFANTVGAISIFLYGFLPSIFRVFGTTGFFVDLINEGVNPFVLIGIASFGEALGSSMLYVLGKYIFRLVKGHHRELADADHVLRKYRILVYFLVPFFGSLGDLIMIVSGHQRVGLKHIFPFLVIGNFVVYGNWLLITIGQMNL
jgi:membrane protein YqaA with SNARE-associated domain